MSEIIDFSRMPSEVISLKDKIEKKLLNPIRVSYGNMTLGANETLINTIQNGIASIIVKKGHAPTVDSIYHELFELYIKAESGVHSISVNSQVYVHIQSACKQPEIIVGKAHSIFCHAFFYPKMIDLNYHPTEYIESQLKALGSIYPITAYQNTDIKLHVSMDLWHLHLGFGDQTSSSRELYNAVSKDYLVEKARAESLNSISNKFTSPDMLSGLFIEIIKCMFNYNGNIDVYRKGTQVVYS
ncbi:MAG: hypothetical protein WCQ90_01470 [Deltaproteobacteria bacterium]